MSAKRIARIALFTAVALLLGLVESALPPLLPFAPGAKMGLSNLATLAAVIFLGYGDAFVVLALRCLLACAFAGNPYSLIYAAPAGILSLAAEILLYHFLYKRVSIVGISFIGALVHNGVQVAIASLTVKTNLALMMPYMLGASVIAGTFVGIVTFLFVKYLPKKAYK